MKGTSKKHRFILWFSLPQRLVYIHVVEVSHKAIGGGFPLSTNGYYKLLGASTTKIGKLPSTL
jgi:hypothetical protein